MFRKSLCFEIKPCAHSLRNADPNGDFSAYTKTFRLSHTKEYSHPDTDTHCKAISNSYNVYIGAPTAARILDAGGITTAPAQGWKWIGNNPNQVAPLKLNISANGNYLQNTPYDGINASSAFHCNQDLVVTEVLFLNNLVLDTDGTGCRIYSTHSVFIQGAITYLNSSPSDTKNLQITSSTGIFLGLSPTILTNRLFSSFFTRNYPNSNVYGDNVRMILNEAALIPDLQDPPQRAIDFSRLLLNAPHVQSRYNGNFSGTIIAEIAMFSLGQFKYTYDPAFDGVNVLPLLDDGDYLVVSPN